MRIPSIFTFAFVATTAVATEAAQLPLDLHSSGRRTAHDGRKKVAVVGAGITAASLAYRLYDEYGSIVPLDITIYEAASQVGGRINSTAIDNRANHYTGFVDTGASVFSADDLCLQAAIDDTGLRRKVVGVPYLKTTVGVWDGQTFILRRSRDLKSRTKIDYVRDALKYGLSARKLQILLKNKLSRFRELYGDSSFPNPSLPDAIQRLGLEEESKKSAYDYMVDNGLPLELLHDIIQPSVRASFAHNLSDLNALSALIAMNPSATYRLNSHPRGNLELAYRLLRLSEARILLNTRVSRIGKSSKGKYTVVISQDNARTTSRAEEDNEYDAVVIATHLQGAGVQFDFPTPLIHSPLPTFVERHITHFTSRLESKLAPSFFNLTTTDDIPDLIFTTPEAYRHHRADIFTIEHSYASAGFHGDVEEVENLYKITSSRPIPDSMIAGMLGKTPESPLYLLGIKWIHRQAWPLASPRRTRGPRLDNIELADGMFYTGISDELLSSMEMNCRIGRRVADIIFQKFAPPLKEAEA